ncbi:ExbD/TolR family protein [Sphingomonas sp. LT1P40]|uniref:ExbD/TolR family protein n=1 Tax=Alteristakelama amylovorans TaxID=3096166 RepID=UPI002FC67BCC
MRRYAAPAEPELFSTMNTTPLIDVLLVLLVMLIITIPVARHKIPVDLPNGKATPKLETPHRLDISASGRLSWDGRAIAEAELPDLLATTVAAQGVLHLKTDAAASYDRFTGVLATVKRAGVTRLGFIGNERMAIE